MDIRALDQQEQPNVIEQYARYFREEIWPHVSDRV